MALVIGAKVAFTEASTVPGAAVIVGAANAVAGVKDTAFDAKLLPTEFTA